MFDSKRDDVAPHPVGLVAHGRTRTAKANTSGAAWISCAIIAVSAVGAGFFVIPIIIDATGGVLSGRPRVRSRGSSSRWAASSTWRRRRGRQNEAGVASIFAVGRLTLTLTLPLPLSISLPLPVPLTRWQGRVRLSSY